MPTELQVQNTILSAEFKLATLVNNNLNLINSGNLPINEDLISFLNLNIVGLQFQADRGDFTGETTIILYNRLVGLIGIDTSTSTFDPNFQNPVNPLNIIIPFQSLQPIVISWANFSTDNSPDGGISRNTYYNGLFMGFNPFMALVSPGLVGLELGIDYMLLPSGGFMLLPTGNIPFIFDGQLISVYSYALQ